MQEDWTEKYRPRSLSKIVGNEYAVQQIRRWAESWLKGAPKFKALVLRGEPGTGKTSAALAMASDYGWDVVEMNASDHRNAESIRRVAGMGAVSQTFSSSGEFLSSARGKRKLIILDEADNLFGREDHGGAKAIVDTIRETGQPIVLIVNDYYELSRKAPAVKTLAERVTFSRLDKRAAMALLNSIAESEEIAVEKEALEGIIENASGDLRAAVNDLQMLVEGRTGVTKSQSAALSKRNQKKDIETSLNSMFSATSLRGARDATLDLDMTPDELEKWIEEAIPYMMRDPSELSAAFDALSKSDVYLGRTRRLQHYGLWAYAKEIMTGGVALSRKSTPRQVIHEARFPSHFIVMSRARGARSARDAVSRKLSPVIHTSASRVSESVLPLLSAMVRNDRELLAKLASDAELDEDDVGYLLGKDSDSPEVSAVLKGRGGDSGEPSARQGKKRGQSSKTKGGLAGF